ncbi:MAG TPA: tetratricopeptide repeat protein [Chthoniobacteraceae bacterium]|jgi:tetratricopeptide (TPR) repeat protein/predicted  nucleic acid-binding Zn-ribbon protein|nr:tetratricopeptide repeat protein [Chthoniobacteraceae bacterium]
MRLKAILLLLLGVLSILTPELRAQAPASDSADRFLTAYQLYQKGEALESGKDFAGALRTLKDALQILNEIAAKDPTWNPTILEFRRKRIVESIARLEAKVGPGGAEPSGLPTLPKSDGGSGNVPDILPDDTRLIPGVSATPQPRGTGKTSKPATGDAFDQIKGEMNDLRAKLAQAEAQRDAAQSSARETQRKLDSAAADRKKLDDQLRVVQQRAEIVEQQLLKVRKDGPVEAEKRLNLETQLKNAKKDVTRLTDERDALEQVRDQELTQHKAGIDRANKAAQASAGFKKQLDEIEKNHKAELAAIQTELTKVKVENTDLKVRLTKVEGERDTFKSEVAKLQQNKKDLDKALADNAIIMTKLADAEKQIVQFKADNAQKDVLIADLKKEITDVSKQLDDAKKASASYQVKMSQFQASLQTTSEKLALADTAATKGTAERKKMSEENELLHGIVVRQMRQQASRDQMSKLVLEQLKELKVKNEDLLTRVKFLGEPVVKLTPKEAALFKKPQVEVGDNEIALAAPKETGEPAPPELPKSDPVPAPAVPPTLALASATPAPLTPPVPAATPAKAVPVAKTSPTPAKNTSPAATPAATAISSAVATPARAAATPKSDTPELAMLDTSRLNKPSGLDLPKNTATATPGGSEPRTEPATGGNITETGAGASTVPADLQPTAAAAKDNFERGNYGAAEKLYETILAKAPTNLYALSNLGVVRFREGKLKLAEEAFRKAIAIAPEDAFSRCTLGIIYYSQTRYDEAVNELTKSLAINPKYAAAHNFLGITASQKGWQEAAQKELETATQLDPNYADAHFNLAVVYATQQPPNKDNARQFYKRATELGAEKDPSLEALLK